MADYIAQLAALTDEELRLNAQDWRDRHDLDRLRAIETERTRLWNLERARRAGHGPEVVPPGGYKLYRQGQYDHAPAENRRSNLAGARLPVASAAELIRDLTAYQEEHHAAE